MKKVADPSEKENVKMWWTHISHRVVDPHVRGDSVIHCVVDLQVKEMRSEAQTATGNRQKTPTEALHHILFFSGCNPYTRESLPIIQNRA